MLMFHGLIAMAIWGHMLMVLLNNSPHEDLRGLKVLLWCTPPALAFALLILLQSFASSDVRGSIYLAFYVVMGAAWVGSATWVVSLLGFDFRDDVDERQNPASSVLYLGVMAGFTLAFAGSNFGEGPSWTVVAYCSLLSMGALLLFWLTIVKMTGAIDAITIDRDTPTGFRLACLLTGSGAVLGRSVAGDWEGATPAFLDFSAHLLPLVLLGTVEVALAYPLRPHARAENFYPAPILRGALPGLAYLGFASWYLLFAGWW